MRKTKIFKIARFFLMTTLVFSWIFSGWPLALAEETATSTSTQTSTSIPNPADEITVQQQADEESVSEEIASPPAPTPLPKPPLKERALNRDFRIAQKAAHRCDAEIFRIDISGRVSAQARILLGGKKVQSGEVEIGSLPIGIDILFSENRDYLHGVSQNDGAFDVEIVNQEGSQKGSFSITMLYTDRESNQITVCQINIVNF